MSSYFEVELEAAPTSESALCCVDFPRTGTRVYGQQLDLAGWAMGRRAPATAVEAGVGARDAVRVTPALARADVAAAFPGIPHAGLSGFYLVAEIPPVERAEVRVAVVLGDGGAVAAATIRLTRRTGKRWSAAEAPLVSVVTPCYNQARFLREALESVRSQTYPRIEAIVVDDGSTDDTANVAAELGIPCIRQKNRGLGAARNRGLVESSGEYVVFLDADDRLLPHGIEANMDAFRERPMAAFASGWGRYISAGGDPIAWPYIPAIPPDGDRYAALLENTYGIPAIEAVMFRRDPILDKGAFAESPRHRAIRGAEDWDLYLRLAHDYGMHPHESGPISEYRQHPEAMSKSAARMLRACLAALRGQRTATWRDSSLRAARRRGIASVRGSYREPLAEELAEAIRRRRWGKAARAALAILRFYPGALPSVLAQARKRRSVGETA